MNVLLAIAGALVVIFLALETRRRTKKRLARSSRTRVRAGGLMLDRPRRNERRGQGTSPSLANPLLLGLVIIVLTAWLAAAYLLPGGEPAAATPAPAASAPVEFSTTLAGRLTADGEPADQRPALMAQAAMSAGADAVGRSQAVAPPPAPTPSPPAVPLTEAALAMGASSSSQLGQVGLLPAQAATKPPAAKPAAQAQSTAAAPRRPAVSATPAPPPSAAPGRSPLVSAAAPSGPATTETIDGDQSASAGSGILAGQHEFTVHLGSFSDRGNAENYKTKLASAGEVAFISEITVEGRLWYRVMSGRFNTRVNAEAHGRDLRRRGLTVDTGRYLIKPLE